MNSVTTRRTTIQNDWRVKEATSRGTSSASDLPWLPAAVPGHVHLDLMRAGVITDPFYRIAERSAAWVDETDWVYETTFQVEEPVAASTYLVFHGLDTIARISLNDELIGETDNMFVPHEFPVASKLRVGTGEAGQNALRIVFSSALRVGRERQKEWTDAGNDSLAPEWFLWGPRSFVRKAQYMYGWDWGPELVSCGIWKPVELVEVPTARLLDWKYDTTFTPDGKAIVRIDAFFERGAGAEEAPLTLTAAISEVGWQSMEYDDPIPSPVTVEAPTGSGRLQISSTITIDLPRRWWPNTHNPEDDRLHPALYTLRLALALADGEPVDEKTARIGLRTVELIREPDPDGGGESFKFRVNGQDTFMKGANWIPADSFPARLEHRSGVTSFPTDRRTEQLIFAACDAGFNMLRVWGGGLYESDHFYELCDEHGILVWQDFPYGCAYYPDTGTYSDAARREAVSAIRRLRTHPSLALWCGNNENDSMHHDGWSGANEPPRYLGEKLYHEILPAAVEEGDPGRPYWPSSPYGGENPNSQEWGDRHDWDVWHGVGDWIHYPADDSRFLSEFGFASSCSLPAWEKCLAVADRWPRSPAVRWHDKTRKGYDTYLGFIGIHFPEPRTLEDLVYYSQLNQAEALKCGIEHWRRRKGRCWGTLFWQFNDCWPVQSWSVVDSELQQKAAYYAARRFYQPVLLSLVRGGNRVEAHLTNDLAHAIRGEVSLTIETFEGEVAARVSTPAEIEANGTGPVATIDLSSAQGRERDVYLHARFEAEDEIQAAENYLFLAEPKDLRLPDPGLEARVERYAQHPGNWTLTIKARRFAAYVWWRFDGVTYQDDSPSTDNFFHLRPGEEKIMGLGDLEAIEDEISGRLRVRSL
ncbi:MAG TPA: glycoside hydrolase family 2 protein [Armatimonadota bacterium]|nr:glycoside hydrolase family 2 protein [Armatimonadota bacterium]